MTQVSNEKYNFYQYESYGNRLIKGISRDKVLNELQKYPLLMKEYKKNEAQIQNRTIETLMREPSNADCPGFIYGFKEYTQHKSDPYAEKYQIKMGRTKRQVPQDRIYEWQKTDGHQYVEIFTIRSQHNNKLESLVHLFFAYARKIKYINGQRRIQWFTFEQKSLNAAVTSMINDLMQKIHRIGKNNLAEIPSLPFDLQNFCLQINNQILNVEILKKRLILFGLRQSGKSSVKAMLSGQKIKSVNVDQNENLLVSKNKYQLSLENHIDLIQNIIEFKNSLQESNQKKEKDINLPSIKQLKKSFYMWTLINSVQQPIIPCLVVTQNDLLSSEMTAFKKTLHNLILYLKCSGNIEQAQLKLDNESAKYHKLEVVQKFSSLRLFIVITKVEKSHNLSQQKIKKYFQYKKYLFNQFQLKILENSSIQLSYQATTDGNYDYDMQKLINEIQTYDFANKHQISFQYFNQNLFDICERIVHFAYQQMADKLQDYFKEYLKNILFKFDQQKKNKSENQNKQIQQTQLQQILQSLSLIQTKLSSIQLVIQFIDNLKSSQKQHQILISLKDLNKLLQISDHDIISLQLIIFCECIIKGNPFNSENSQLQNNSLYVLKKQNIFSKPYLLNSLVFCKITEKIQSLKEEIREEINYIIDRGFKQNLGKVLTSFYNQFNQKTLEEKLVFDQTYNILFKIMNIHQVIQSQKIERKNQIQNISNQTLEKDNVLKLMDQLLQHSKKRQSKFLIQIIFINQNIKKFYQFSEIYKIKLSNLMSRIRQCIYLATKNKRPIEMIHFSQQDQKTRSKQSQNTNNTNKYRKNNSTKSSNQQLKTNGQAKMIFNKKDEGKNQRLINYINSKKEKAIKLQQQKKAFQNNQSSNKANIISFKQVTEKSDRIGHQKDLNENQFNKSQGSQQQYFSFPEQGDWQDQLQTAQIDFKPITTRSKKTLQFKQIQKVDSQNQINENYLQFISQLNGDFNSIKNKSNCFSLKDLYNRHLIKVQKEQNYNSIIFNCIQNQFHFDTESITFHNSFIVIFAKNIVVNKDLTSSGCNINFKVHYKNRKPIRINLILVGQNFEGTQQLNIEDNRFGKVLMVKLQSKVSRNFRVLNGYYTKNKRNEKKLEQFYLKELIEGYCKVIN